MQNRGKIIIGLLVCAALVGVAFYWNFGKPVPKPEPKIDTPVIKEMV